LSRSSLSSGRGRASILLGAGSVFIAAAAHALSGPYAGRFVAEVLAEAEAEGVNIVFNTTVVPDSLRVIAEPEATSTLAIVNEILAQHGLALEAFGPGNYAVTSAPAARAARAGAEPSREDQKAAARVLEEIVVTTSRYSLGADTTGSHTLVTSEAIQTIPRLAEEALKAVQRLPGVATNGVSGLSPVRGGEPGETLILLDGLTLYEPFHLKNFLSPVSLLDARFIDSLDFHSGGFVATWGDRMSAVIDAHSRPANVPPKYELGLSLFHVSGLASGTVNEERGSWLVSVRQSTLGKILRALETDIGSPEYSDGFVRVDYALSDTTSVALNVLASHDEIDVDWDRSGEVATADYRNMYVWATLDHAWGNGIESRAIVSFTQVENSRAGEVLDPGRSAGEVHESRDFDAAGVSLDFSWEGFHGLHRWGGEAIALSSTYDYQSAVHFEPDPLFPDLEDTTRNLETSPRGWKYAAYWTSRFRLAESLVTEIGLRFEDQEYTGPEHSIQTHPRVSFLYTPAPGTHLRASWGRYSQSQRINELQIEDGIDTFAPAQHASHLVLSADHDLANGLSIRIEAYRKDYDDLRTRYENLFNPLVLLPELQPDRVAVTPSSARVRGVEVSMAWHPGTDFSGWLSYAWSEADDVIDGRKIPRSWDQTHAVSAGIRYAHGPWDFTLADTFHTGWPTTRASLVSIDGATTAVVGQRNDARLGSYNSLDMRLSRRFELTHGEIETYLEVTNLTNRRNPCCVDYRVTSGPDGDLGLDTDTQDWLGIVPSIGVLWKY
jgi:outer membrane receptor protein involved in Fe transport